MAFSNDSEIENVARNLDPAFWVESDHDLPVRSVRSSARSSARTSTRSSAHTIPRGEQFLSVSPWNTMTDGNGFRIRSVTDVENAAGSRSPPRSEGTAEDLEMGISNLFSTDAHDASRADKLSAMLKAPVPEPELENGSMYQAKKVIAQGLLDIALLTANASQLKNLLTIENHPSFALAMTLLIISIVLQITTAITLLIVARLDYDPSAAKREKNNKRAIIINDMATLGIFLITVVNIFIATFISHGTAYIPEYGSATLGPAATTLSTASLALL